MNVDPAFAPLLRERARRLARPMEGTSMTRSSVGLLAFRVGDETFAIATDAVAGVNVAPRPVPLPGLPGWLAGMVGVHGRALAAVWLDRFFGGGPGAGSDRSAERVVVVESDRVRVGLMATAVDGIGPAVESDPLPLPQGISPTAQDCAVGIDHGHLILDASRLVRAIGIALGSSFDGAPGSLIQAIEGDGSHANQP